MTSHAVFPQLPRILLGTLIGAILGLLMLGVALAAWWLAVARHEPQRLSAPDDFEARLEAAAGSAAFGLDPIYVHDPAGVGAEWLASVAPELEAQGRELRPAPSDDAELVREIERLAGRWAEPPRRPLLIWRGDEGLMLCRCDHPRARAQARLLLARPQAEPETQEAQDLKTPPSAGRQAGQGGSAYPRLGPPEQQPLQKAEPAKAPASSARPSPPSSLPGDPAPAGGTQAKTATAPARAPGARPSSPRRTDPPEARRDADSLFF